jgi:hypothetical protein
MRGRAAITLRYWSQCCTCEGACVACRALPYPSFECSKELAKSINADEAAAIGMCFAVCKIEKRAYAMCCKGFWL